MWNEIEKGVLDVCKDARAEIKSKGEISFHMVYSMCDEIGNYIIRHPGKCDLSDYCKTKGIKNNSLTALLNKCPECKQCYSKFAEILTGSVHVV